jgi:hypothetical protein
MCEMRTSKTLVTSCSVGADKDVCRIGDADHLAGCNVSRLPYLHEAAARPVSLGRSPQPSFC